MVFTPNPPPLLGPRPPPTTTTTTAVSANIPRTLHARWEMLPGSKQLDKRSSGIQKCPLGAVEASDRNPQGSGADHLKDGGGVHSSGYLECVVIFT